jgi:hypothetical protein
VGKNTIEDVVLNGGLGVNMITNFFCNKLGLPKPKPTPYNLRMVDQTTFKLVGLIQNMKIMLYGVPYVMTFMVLQNNVMDVNYLMLLGKMWNLWDAKVSHD